MARSWKFPIISLLPPILVGGAALLYAAHQALFITEWDMKFGCYGWAQMLAFFGVTALGLSSAGFFLGCFPHRTALRELPSTSVFLVTAFLAFLVALIAALALPLWPLSVLGVSIGWVLVAAIVSWASIAVVRWAST